MIEEVENEYEEVEDEYLGDPPDLLITIKNYKWADLND